MDEGNESLENQVKRAPNNTDLKRLLDEEAVRRVLVSYCRGIDCVDQELLASCYHPGALDHHPGLTKEQEGDFVAYAIQRGQARRAKGGGTRHYLTNVQIEISGDSASSEAYVYAYHWSEPYDDPARNFAAGARYVDRLERREGEWKIADRGVIQAFREDFAPGAFSFYMSEPHLGQSDE